MANAPRVTSNDTDFQAIFDAYSDYLDRLSLDEFDIREKLVSGKGILLIPNGSGESLTIEADLDAFEEESKWQLLRVGSALYVQKMELVQLDGKEMRMSIIHALLKIFLA